MQLRKLLCAAIILMSWRALAEAEPPIDPLKTWKVLETEHFEVIYDEDNRALAEKFANEAERADTFLEPVLHTTVRKKIPLVIADITDDSNGEASAFPRPEIQIYPVLPSVFDPTSEYYSWTREVITHEYTHILNFEPASGFMKVLRYVFGTIISPGGYLPRWYTEGLAVEMESRMTPVGRGRSHYYSALVRSQVEDGTWGSETVDRINATMIPTWPRGQRPYTFGYFLMHQLGEDTLTDQAQNDPVIKDQPAGSVYGLLDNRYGGRVPWFINGPVEDTFGKDYAGLLADMYNNMATKAQAQLQKLKASGAQNGAALAQSGYFNFGAQISPDHLKLAAIVSDYNDYPGIRIWTRKNTASPFSLEKDIPAPVINNKDIHQVSWLPDSRHLVYDHSDVWRHYHTVNDLYLLDTVTGDETRLTEGLRAREATVMPDGSLVFVIATSTKTQLAHSDGQGQHVEIIYSPGDGERVSSPRPYLDGVIFSHRDSHGREWIEKYSFSTKQVMALTHAHTTGEMNIMPVPDPKQLNGFYYAASQSGVMNIYHFDGVQSKPVTNVTTYATSPVIDETGQELLYTRLTARGFELESAPLKNMTPRAPAVLADMQNYPKADETDAPKTKILDEHKYHGVSYLFPQYWMPFVYIVPGGAIFDASTSNSDPLNHHQYSIDVGYDTRASQPYEDIVYTNASLPFFIDAEFANDYLYLAGAGLTEHVTYGVLDTRHYLLPNSNKWTIGPELSYHMIDYSPYLYTQAGPGIAVNYSNIATVKDFQISPESGEAFSVGYDYFLPTWGNTSFPNVHGTAAWYLSGKPLPDHHVISLKASAWVSPQQQTILAGAIQSGGEYFGSLVPPTFLVRGYPVGEFIGWSTYVGNLEYRFPIAEPYKGWGTFPVFLQKIHGALLLDAATLQGGFYDSDISPSPLVKSDLGTFFLGTGGELRTDLQIFYGLPFTMRLGLYYGLTQKAFGGFNYMLSFGSVL